MPRQRSRKGHGGVLYLISHRDPSTLLLLLQPLQNATLSCWKRPGLCKKEGLPRVKGYARRGMLGRGAS